MARRSGFTLVELMIVVSIIAVVSGIALPNLMAARMSANESAAIATLKQFVSSQIAIQNSRGIDVDGDGVGEFGWFAEMTGVLTVRDSLGPHHGPLLAGRRIGGAHVRDEVGGAEFDIRARTVIDATGVWAGRADGAFPALRAGGQGAPAIRPSRGSHIIVRRDRIASSSGLTIRVPGKVVFLVPWPDHWIIGTTDLPFEGAPDDVVPTRDEVAELLGTVNRTLDVDLTRDDLVGPYELPARADDGADGSTVQASDTRASRDHRGQRPRPHVSGGMETTYRVMARRRRCGPRHHPRPADPARPPASATEDLPVVGAAVRSELDFLAAALAARLAPHRLERPRDRLVAATGRRRPPWSSSARSSACSGRWPRTSTTSRPRSCGPSAASMPSVWPTSWPGGRGWPRSASTGPPRWPPG
jgi:prepilin-type N-terminal cleavage/methylation domain-containing protein